MQAGRWRQLILDREDKHLPISRRSISIYPHHPAVFPSGIFKEEFSTKIVEAFIISLSLPHLTNQNHPRIFQYPTKSVCRKILRSSLQVWRTVRPVSGFVLHKSEYVFITSLFMPFASQQGTTIHSCYKKKVQALNITRQCHISEGLFSYLIIILF